jgi:hypothetical protein
MRLYTMFAVMIALLAGLYGVYQLKYQVRGIKREAANLNAQLEEEYKNLHVLKAEWVYLNRPARLEELSRRHLDLVPLAANQVVDGNAMAVLDVPVDAGAPEGGNQLASETMISPVTPASEVRYGR